MAWKVKVSAQTCLKLWINTNENAIVVLFLVKPILFQKVSAPEFTFGELVRVWKNPEVFGSIYAINWHHKTRREMYFIEVNGKKKSSRYFNEELISVEGA